MLDANAECDPVRDTSSASVECYELGKATTDIRIEEDTPGHRNIEANDRFGRYVRAEIARQAPKILGIEPTLPQRGQIARCEDCDAHDQNWLGGRRSRWRRVDPAGGRTRLVRVVAEAVAAKCQATLVSPEGLRRFPTHRRQTHAATIGSRPRQVK